MGRDETIQLINRWTADFSIRYLRNGGTHIKIQYLPHSFILSHDPPDDKVDDILGSILMVAKINVWSTVKCITQDDH